jgi:uncharacterized protein (DUF488 family)
MEHVIHTMGLGDRSLETILEALAAARVTRVVDIRRYGTSARHPHHDARALHGALAGRGIEVCDLGHLLGGDRPGGYGKHMSTGAFRRGLERLEALAADRPVVVLCAERDAERCHRRLLGAALEERGWKVAHHGLTLSERTARGHLRLHRKTG